MKDTPYVLSCETPADLSQAQYEKRNIRYLCYPYTLSGRDYTDDLGKTLPYDEFFAAMAAGADTKTRQVNSEDFIEYFTPMLASGHDVLHVCLSSGLTGVLTPATLAQEALKERFPDRKLLIVDSLGASRGYGLLMDKLADLRDEGLSIEALQAWANEHCLNVHHWFYSTDLTYYVRGGRVTKAEGWFGTVLHICPLLDMDDTGHLVPRMKCRGKKSVMREIVKRMEENAEGGLAYSGKCYMNNAACLEDAQLVAQMVEERFPNLQGHVEIESIGPIIGSHTGPGTVALFFWGKKREA